MTLAFHLKERRSPRWTRLRLWCRKTALPTALVAALAACGGTTESSLSIQLGTLDPADPMAFRFLPLSDDMQVQLAGGAQGGFHIWTLYRVTGNTVDRRVRVRRYIDRLGSGGKRDRILTADASEHLPPESPWELLTPIPSFVCPTPIGVNALDAPLELKARFEDISDASQVLGEATVRVSAVCPPEVAGDTQRAFCMSICVGK